MDNAWTSDPYGAYLTPVSFADATEQHFTGKERDTESGNDYFGARYYSSAMGRFMSPDWSAQEEPVPYAKLDDPQSLNLYSYVYNNPLAKADPDGHCPQCLIWGEELLEEAAESPAGQYVLGGIAAGGSAAGAWLVENGGRPSNSAMAPDLSTNSDGTSIYMRGSQTTQAPAPASASGQSTPAPASGQSTPASPQEPNKDQGGGNSKKPSSPNQMNQEVKRGQAPKDVERVDKPHVPGDQNHVHLTDGSAQNQDGTTHHGTPSLSNAVSDWLKKHGW
jgi:RHS repeat-associated protein